MTQEWYRRVEWLQSEYGREIQRYCYVYLADAESARDSAQDVLCKLLMSEEYTINAERAWLYRCARNHCLNTLRHRARGSRALAHAARFHTVQQLQMRPLLQLVRDEIHERLNELVHNLPLHLRIPLFLRYFAAFSRAEIMEHLGLPEHTVKRCLHRALKELRKHSSLRLS